MTIMGCGGTGKSELINTLVSCIRKIFKNNNTVFVTAPTGAAEVQQFTESLKSM
jgi:predicted GTPase